MVFENGCLRAVRFFLSLVFDLFKNISLVGTENDLVCQMAQVDDFCSCSRVFRPPPFLPTPRPSLQRFAHEMNFNLFYFDPHVHVCILYIHTYDTDKDIFVLYITLYLGYPQIHTDIFCM